MPGRKILSVALSVVLVVGLLPLPAYAGEGGGLSAAQPGLTAGAFDDGSRVAESDDGEGTAIEGVIESIAPGWRECQLSLYASGDFTAATAANEAGEEAVAGLDPEKEAELRSRFVTCFLNGGARVDAYDLEIPAAWADENLDGYFSLLVNETDTGRKPVRIYYSLVEPAGASCLGAVLVGRAWNGGFSMAEQEEAVAEALSWVPANATRIEQLKALHDWLCLNCRYDHDYFNALVQYFKDLDVYDAAGGSSSGLERPEFPSQRDSRNGLVDLEDYQGMLVERVGVCGDYAEAFMYLAWRLGIECEECVNTLRDADAHGWDLVKLDDSWYHIDVTWDDLGGYADTDWFLKSDEVITKERIHKTGARGRAIDTRYDAYSLEDWPEFKGPAEHETVSSFSLSAESLTMKASSNATLSIESFAPDLEDDVLVRAGAKWVSSDPAVVAVSNRTNYGRCLLEAGVKPGTATVSCTLGDVTRTCDVTVWGANIEGKAFTVEAQPSALTYTGELIEPDIVVSTVDEAGETVNLKQGEDFKVFNDDFLVMTSTVATAAKWSMPGTYEVWVTGCGNYSGAVKAQYRIDPRSLSDPSVSVSIPDRVEFDGRFPVEPVAITYNGKELRDGIDYKASYSNNDRLGTASVVVTGSGGFTGEVSADFEIAPADIQSARFEVEDCDYTGDVRSPKVRAWLGDTLLREGVDYDLAYSDNVNAGQGSVTVSGKGNFTGQKTVRFPINPVDVSLVNWSQVGEKLVYDGREKRPEISGNWRGHTLEESVDFEVAGLSENTDIGTATATVRGLGNFTGEAAVPFTIFAASMDDVDVDGPADMTYSGAACEPGMTLRLGDVTLVQGTDYDLAYRDNVDAGWARVTATGKGNFAGSLTRTFLIGKADVADVDIAAIAVQGYTGEEREPSVSASFGSKQLVEGVDYTLSYRNNVSVGSATAVVLGIGNFAGRRLVSFDIALGDGPYDIAAADIAPLAAQAFAGTDVEPGVKAEFAGVRLEEGTDYRLSYSDNSAPGKASATVTGIGRFTGSVELPFDITVKDLSGGRVEIEQGPFVYSGSAQEPGVSVFSDGVELTGGVDYQVEYADNVNAGTATVTVTGAGAYGGSIVRTFAISPASVSSATFADIADVVYSGVRSEPAVVATFNGEELVAGEDGDFTVTYQSNDKAGTAQAVVEGRGNFAGVAKVPFAIVPADVSRADVSKIAGREFCGAAITPVPSVVLDGRVLVRNVDYALSYSDNVNVGSAGVTVTGKGNYSGSVEAGFEIVPADIAGASARFLTSGLIAYAASRTKTPAFELVLNGYKLVAGTDFTAEPDGVGAGSREMLVTGKGNFTGSLALPFEVTPADIASAKVANVAAQSYTGSAVEPALSISYAGEELVAGRDFECSYADNVEPGTASVTIVGKGNFTGSGTTTFVIRKAASTTVSLLSAELSPIPAQTYTGSAVVPPVELVYDGVVLAEGHDYSVTCLNNTDVTKRAVVSIDGMGAFTGNMMATFEIAAADIAEADAAPIAAQTFTGSAIRPKTSLTFNGVAVTEGYAADYTLSYSSNIHAGTATAFAMGQGNFTGMKAVTFQIEPADIAGATVTFSPVKYSKGGVDVTASVRLGSNSLVQGTDFEVVGSTAGMAVGSRKLSVSGKGDYTGTATGSITVEKASLASAEISGVPAQVAWTGSAVTLDDVVVTLDGYVLAEGVDYALSYSRNVNVGTASLYVSGRNGYAGSSAHAEFEIVKSGVAPVGDNDIAHALVTLDGEAPVYSGAPVEPRLKVSLGGQELVEGTDYTVGYSSNVDVGEATAEIVGIGSYSGSQTVSFVIQAADISTASAGAVSVGYSAAGFVPAFEVVWNGRTLVAGTDYELPASTAGWLPGDYTVALKGKGNFTGELAAKLTVSGSGSSGDDGPQKTTPVALKSLKLASVSAVYDGKAHKPVVKQVVAKSGAPKASDYTLTYWRGSAQTSDFTSAGTITVRAKGSGSGFTGTVSATYTIRAAALASVRLAASSAVYDGKAHKPVVKSVTAKSGTPKSKISDYALTFWRGRVQTADFTSAGTITVKAQGKLNFAGAATATFTIAKAAPKITAKATSKAVKAKAAKKKAQVISLGAKSSSGGKLTYKVLKSNKKVKFRSGKATLAKGAKKGSYSVKVRVTSAAKGNYKQGCKDFTITFKVRG